MYKIIISPQDLGYLRLFLDLVAEENNNEPDKSKVREDKKLNNNYLIIKNRTKTVSENN